VYVTAVGLWEAEILKVSACTELQTMDVGILVREPTHTNPMTAREQREF
jgi:hypothetical protein